jgi:hypothetical protein
MAARRLLPLALMVVLLALPGLACAAGWLLTARPGAANQTIALPLGTARRVVIAFQPCSANTPGRVRMWYVTAGQRTRLNPERHDDFYSLLGVTTAPPCVPGDKVTR